MDWSVANDGKHKYKVVIIPELWNKYRKDKITRPKTVKFGAIGFEHFIDKSLLGKYSHLNHYDLERRKRYHARHKKDYPMFSPDWFSKTFLW